MQNWQDLYKELAERILEKMPEIRWIDLWHNQTNFLEEEHSFPTPAIFMSFRSNSMADIGLNVQIVNLQVDFYLFYETYLDTFNGAYNEDGALSFTASLDRLFGIFHGTSGENYSGMRRIAFNPEDTGGSGNLYRASFVCQLEDSGAMKDYNEVAAPNIELTDDLENNGFIIRPD